MLGQLSRTAIAGFLAASLASTPLLQAQQSAPAQPAAAASSAPSGPSDPWPRRLQAKQGTFLIYQPQLDTWKNNLLEAHAAVSVQPTGAKDPTFGVIWFTARTDVDKTNRLVYLEDLTITRSSFPSAPEKAAAWVEALHELEPSKRSKAISLDRLEADLGITQAKTQGEARPLDNTPPQVIFSNVPAVLVRIDGQPVYKPQSGTDLQRIINTSAIVLKADSGELYLHLFDGWMEASSLQGPWKVSDPHFGRKDNLDKALKEIIAAKNGDPMTGGSASDPKAPKPSLKTKPDPVVYMATAADGADRRQRPAELPGDSGNAAPLRRKHVGTRVQGHRQPEHLRAHRGTLVQRAGHVRARGPTSITRACRRTSRRSPTTARWRTRRPPCPARSRRRRPWSRPRFRRRPRSSGPRSRPRSPSTAPRR